MLHLEEIDQVNWRLDLHVTEEQRRCHYVSEGNSLLARAYAFRDCRSQAFVIYADELPVGMALYYDCDPMDAYDFSQLFIDARYQGRGYGFAATRQILARMKADGKYQKAVLCYIEGNEAARRLYEKAGFRPTGEVDGDEVIMEMSLESAL